MMLGKKIAPVLEALTVFLLTLIITNIDPARIAALVIVLGGAKWP